MQLSRAKFLPTPRWLVLSGMLAMVVFGGASCGQPADGGVFRSVDEGETWEQKVFAGQSGRRAITIADVSLLTLTAHPDNPTLLFAGSEGKGIYITFDGGDMWYPLNGVTTGNIYSIAFDKIDPNNIYASRSTTIIKSSNGGDNWEQVYVDVKNGAITDLVVDSFDNSNVYAATSAGSVLKSKDFGVTWDLILSDTGRFNKILMDQNDTRILYALTSNGKFYRSTTGGEPVSGTVDAVNSGWVELIDAQFDNDFGVKKIVDAAIDVNNPNNVYVASKRGLQVSRDRGATWTDIITLFGYDNERNEQIKNLLVLPGNSSVIQFTVGNAIHKSTDGGANWKVINALQTTRQLSSYVIDPESPTVQYISTRFVEEKGGFIKR